MDASRDGLAAVVTVAHGAADPAVTARLSEGDRKRFAALDGDRAAAFLAGRSALSSAARAAGAATEAEALIEAPCADCGRSHGRPVLVGVETLHLSLSHAAGRAWAVAALAPVGLDVEPLDTGGARLAAVDALAPGAGDPLLRWTAVEAVLKADGRGLRVDPREVVLKGTVARLGTASYDLRTGVRSGCRVTVAVLAA